MKHNYNWVGMILSADLYILFNYAYCYVFGSLIPALERILYFRVLMVLPIIIVIKNRIIIAGIMAQIIFI